MADKKQYVTKQGLKKIQNELDELKQVKRKEIAERISEAKELGDLSENAEYIEAKEEQGFVESRIIELEQMLKNTELISTKTGSSTVQVGSTITVESESGDELTYTIVGSSEANPEEKLISNESPLGSAFLKKKVGETVSVETPQGTSTYSIKKIQ